MVNHGAVGTHKDQMSKGVTTNLPACVMDQPVMRAAQTNQVGQVSGTAIFPVCKMVPIGLFGALTQGKPTPVIASIKKPFHGRGDAAM